MAKRMQQEGLNPRKYGKKFYGLYTKINRLFGTKSFVDILCFLEKNEDTHYGRLYRIFHPEDSQFNQTLKLMKECGMVSRTVHQDRTTTYSLGPLAPTVISYVRSAYKLILKYPDVLENFLQARKEGLLK